MANNKQAPKTFCTTREAAEILSVSLRTAQLWTESGLLEAWKTEGGHRRISRQSIERLLADPTVRELPKAEDIPPQALKILVVEDDPALRRLYEVNIRRWPMPLVFSSADDGYEALIRIGHDKPDLLIADLQMPGMDGFRMLNTLCRMIMRNRELESNYQQLNELIKSSNDMHLVTDRDGLILEANPAACQIAEQDQLERSNLQSWVRPSHLEQFNALLAAARQDASPAAREGSLLLRRMRPDAPAILVSAKIVYQQRGTDHLHWLLRETTQHNAEYDPSISAMMLLNAVEGVMVTDQNGKILSVNPAFTEITGYSQSEAIGQNPRILNSGTQDQAFYRNFWQSLNDNGNWKGELYNKRKNGEVYLQRLSVSAVRDEEGRTLSYISIFFDQSQTEKKLVHLAHHDALTGLANRVLLEERVGQQLAQARRSAGKFTLIFIDLDSFKQINDTLGHAVGDGVLREAANRLTVAVRESDSVARLGGDEFVILATDLSGDEDIRVLCHKTIAALCKPMNIDGHEVDVGGSFGCAEYPRHGDNGEALILHADQAMYQAKSAGGNACVIYQADVELPC